MQEGRQRIRKIEGAVARALRSHVVIRDLSDVVRELLENSVDANATEVCLRFRSNEYFEVICEDNGTGLIPEELQLVGEPHFTSKFTSNNIEGLQHVQTFGFRGQALHSIIDICSKVQISSGTHQIIFDKGVHPGSVRDATSFSKGVIVTAKNIFGTLPVRQARLLKESESGIISRIRNALFHIAVTHSNVALKIYKMEPHKPDTLIVSTSRDHSQSHLADALRSVYGISLSNEYETFVLEHQDIKLEGLISFKTGHDSNYQFTFLNNRRLLNPQLTKSINTFLQNSGFTDQDEVILPNFSPKELSPKKGKSPTKIVGKPFSKHAIYIFAIEGQQSSSDLIQDPSKIIFNSADIESFETLILKSLKNFLESGRISSLGRRNLASILNGSTRQLKRIAKPLSSRNESKKLKTTSGSANNAEKPVTSSEGNSETPKSPNGIERSETCDLVLRIDHGELKSVFFPGVSNLRLSIEDLSRYKVVGQVDKKFILIQVSLSNQSILLAIDQHACDERIQVERFFKGFIERTILLKEPDSVAVELNLEFRVSENDLNFLREFSDSFNVWGIRFKCSGNILRVTHLPFILNRKVGADAVFLESAILQHCSDLRAYRRLKVTREVPVDWWACLMYMPKVIVDILNSRACRSAIMFGESLSADQCQFYVSRLFKCKLPFQCAHGRPSIVPLVDLDLV